MEISMEKIRIEKSGVAEYTEDVLYINAEDIVSEAMNRVKMARPKTNYMGAFAARVCLTIDILGDMEGDQHG